MTEELIIKTFRSGATGLIRSLCNEIKLVEHINHVVTWDEKQWKVSPGQHILALVINALCGRVPLYRGENFYEDQDVEGLFGAGRTPDDFNHFALGRALDTFYDAGAKSIFTALTLRNLLAGSAPLRFAHGNTTSKVMYPMFVDSLFLKTPERIEAPGYVLLIALFVYITLEERIRTALRQHNLRLEPVRGWRTSKPAAKQVILMLEHIVTIYWYNRETGKWQRQIQQNEKAKQRNSETALGSSWCQSL